MKTQVNTKTKLPILSRLTQKTYISVCVAYFVISVATIGQYYFSALQASVGFHFGLDVLYPLVSTIAPLVIFLTVYVISTEKVTKLWRVSKGLIITVMAMIFETLAGMVTMYAFSATLGYNNTPAASYSYLIELIPYVLALVVAVVLSLAISKSKEHSVSDASVLLQTLFLVFALLFGLGQPLLSLLPFGGSQPVVDAGMLMGIAMSIVIAVVVAGILYLLTSKKRTVLTRSFIAIFYITLAVLLSVALSSAPYIFINPTAGYVENGLTTYLPMVAALVGFAAIVVWHKMKKVL